MGLDMYVYRIRKAKLEDREYTTEELSKLGLGYVSVKDAESDMHLFAQLLPYTIKRNVSAQFYNVKQIIEDYNLPKDSHIGMISYERIVVGGRTDSGEYVSQEVFREEIEKKYIETITDIYYVWEREEEVAYWRKHYDLQDWIYDNVEGVDNTGYYILNAETIRELNKKFDECLPEEDPTDESALFYWEWY